MRKTILLLGLLTLGTWLFSMYLLNELSNRAVTIRSLKAMNLQNEQNMELIMLNNDKLASQNEVLRLSTKTISQSFPKLESEIKELDVKLKRLKSYSTYNYSLELPVRVELKDSVKADSMSIKTFRYNDGYFDIKGVAISDTQELKIKYRDTLRQVVFKGDRIRPWLWIFSKRKLMQRITLGHPNASIIYSKHIEIEP